LYPTGVHVHLESFILIPTLNITGKFYGYPVFAMASYDAVDFMDSTSLQSSKPALKIRKDFPESWIWENLDNVLLVIFILGFCVVHNPHVVSI
jgi:hypothetical protein